MNPVASPLERVLARLGPRALHDRLTPEQRQRLRFSWRANARPIEGPFEDGAYRGQLPPPGFEDGSKTLWAFIAGRRSGKNWTGSHWVCDLAERDSSAAVALVGRTIGDARKIMVFGPSGILRIAPPWSMPRWFQTDQALIWPNGAKAFLYSAEEPEKLRGPEHSAAWCDELCSWSYPETWDMLQMTLSGGSRPRTLVTTTPRISSLLEKLLADPGTVVTRGSTMDNASHLPRAYYAQILARYAGTDLGRQELEGVLLKEVAGALWNRADIEQHRVAKAPVLQRVVIAVDPSASTKDRAALCGIVAVGLGEDGHGYVLEDASLSALPEQWACRVATAYETHSADCVVAEVNHGGALIESVLRAAGSMPVKLINASRGKYVRAEPVSVLYKQGKVHNVGCLSNLEDQLCSWTPDQRESPDRLDAMVYGVTELMIQRNAFFIA